MEGRVRVEGPGNRSLGYSPAVHFAARTGVWREGEEGRLPPPPPLLIGREELSWRPLAKEKPTPRIEDEASRNIGATVIPMRVQSSRFVGDLWL